MWLDFGGFSLLQVHENIYTKPDRPQRNWSQVQRSCGFTLSLMPFVPDTLCVSPSPLSAAAGKWAIIAEPVEPFRDRSIAALALSHRTSIHPWHCWATASTLTCACRWIVDARPPSRRRKVAAGSTTSPPPDRSGASPPVGQSQFPLTVSLGQSLGSHRWAPCCRRCLLKDCERWFLPRHPRARYCSPDCQKAAQRWRRWHASQRYRATNNGKQRRRDQSRRYRSRARQSLPLPQPVPPTP